MTKTYSPKASDIKRDWHVIDAAGRPLGRVAVEAAALLRGKHKAMFSTHMDVGDFVIIINAAKVRMTGKKSEGKIYYRHTGYPGGLKEMTFAEMVKAHPTRPLEHAIKGMIPHTRQGRSVFTRLKVYAGEQHPHAAQVSKS